MLCENSNFNLILDILYIDYEGVWNVHAIYELKELFYADCNNCIAKIHTMNHKTTLKTYEN